MDEYQVRDTLLVFHSWRGYQRRDDESRAESLDSLGPEERLPFGRKLQLYCRIASKRLAGSRGKVCFDAPGDRCIAVFRFGPGPRCQKVHRRWGCGSPDGGAIAKTKGTGRGDSQRRKTEGQASESSVPDRRPRGVGVGTSQVGCRFFFGRTGSILGSSQRPCVDGCKRTGSFWWNSVSGVDGDWASP